MTGENIIQLLSVEGMAEDSPLDELIFMSIEQKVEMVKYLGDTGTLYENEKRVAFGLKPMKELEGNGNSGG